MIPKIQFQDMCMKFRTFPRNQDGDDFLNMAIMNQDKYNKSGMA